MNMTVEQIAPHGDLPAEIRRLTDQNVRLRAKLTEVAKECASCGGTGCVTVDEDSGYARTEDCGDCLDICEALK